MSKSAIVLGGTSGIGRAVVDQLRERGMRVIAASRRDSADADHEQVDVLDRDALSDLFVKYAPFDYLVNAATGGERATGPFLEMDLDGFQGSFAKLWGYVNSVRLAAQHMNTNGAITLVSGYPARKCEPGMSAISTVGNAVEGFVRAIAPELAPLRINAVAPGLIDTEMFTQTGAERESLFTNATANYLIPRAGRPEEVASAIVFQLENEFVTGTVIDVDGGALLP